MASQAARYELQPEPVGKGGFGHVRKARDTILERTVAVKSLDPILAEASPSDRERFRREARCLAQLSHPHIPAIYDVSFTDKELHIIFQYVEGLTVRELIREGPLSMQEAQHWFSDIASALEHAHGRGILHRDIKPENMMVTGDRRDCYLLDFGISLSAEDRKRLTRQNYVIGTPGYMSPEQEEGKELDSSDDIYVLGVCLYEVLSGSRIALGDYEDLHVENEAIPPAIDSLIRGCIEGKPRRLGSAAEFRKRLMMALEVQQPLSEILAKGRLHDLIGAVRDLTPEEFMRLPAGQRRLVLGRCEDLVASTDPKLALPMKELLALTTRLAMHAPPDDYQPIVRAALEHGFEREHPGKSEREQPHRVWVGDRRIREALNEAALGVQQENHSAVCHAVIGWVDRLDIDAKENWFYHSLRELLDRLLANPECSEAHAEKLGQIRKCVNDHQRARTVPEGRVGAAATQPDEV